MVKRLLNKMDFEALEVKIQKCKVSVHETMEIMSCTSLLPPSSPLISQELFYLLADTEQVEQGGVVTVSSLAVELQAGESLL